MKIIQVLRMALLAICLSHTFFPAMGADLAPVPLEERVAKLEAAQSGINSGDNAWMLVSCALVLMMSVFGLILVYGGLVRKKNVLATMMHTLFLMDPARRESLQRLNRTAAACRPCALTRRPVYNSNQPNAGSGDPAYNRCLTAVFSIAP